MTSTSETAPLLQNGRAVEVVTMRYYHIPLGNESFRKAFETDSLMPYFSSADSFPRLRQALTNLLGWTAGIHQDRMVTVDGGMALMKYSRPGNSANPLITVSLMKLLSRTRSEELKKRNEEFGTKTRAMVLDLFGEKLKDMYEIQVLATHPAAQGRGYGSALVRYVVDKSDANGHDIWLVTTDAWQFYEYLGFTKLRSASVGDDNPAWEGGPISIHIMYRASKLSSEYKQAEEP